jgi:folate-binding protein YgfZ
VVCLSYRQGDSNTSWVVIVFASKDTTSTSNEHAHALPRGVVNGQSYGYIFSVAYQSPLADFHRANGALFGERNGNLVIAHFGNPASEYSAVRSAVGLIDRTNRGLLQFTGADRLSFLQGMLSNDLGSLQPFEGQYATLLTQQGKVVADIRVLCSLNSFYLDFWQDLRSKILDHLNHYLVADEVEITDRSAEYAILSIQGPKAEALLRKLAGLSELPTRPKQHAMVTIEGAAVCVVRDSDTGESGFDLIIPRTHLFAIAKSLTATGTSFGAAWVGEDAHNVLRIEAGVPRYGIDFSEDNLLLEVGIDHAVSFTKGCYLGQEVVERIRSRGHVNKRLVGLLVAGSDPVSAGDRIIAADIEVGHLTSFAVSPALKQSIALGYIHKDFWNAGTRVVIRHNGERIDATISDLPFVKTGQPA